MRKYCEIILGFDQKSIEQIININKNDENIHQIIEYIIQKTKKDSSGYFCDYNTKNN